MYITEFGRFCTYDEHVLTLKDGGAVPDSVSIKKFLKWWAGSSMGRLQEVVNLTSAKTTWRRFQAITFRLTGKRVEPRVNEDILAVRGQNPWKN